MAEFEGPGELTLTALWHRLKLRPSAEFMLSPTGRLTYGELAELVARFCAAFDARSLQPGDRLMILAQEEFAAVAAFVAALLDGLVPIMLAPDTPTLRASALAELVQPAAAVVQHTRLGESWLALVPHRFVLPSDATANRRGWRLRKPSDAEQLASAVGLPQAYRVPRLPGDLDGLAYVAFTSGTTQSPSGVMITRRNLLSNLGTIARVMHIDAASRIFNDMVLAHADGLIQGPIMALATGGTVIRGGGFALQRLEDWLNQVRRFRATHFVTVPTVWTLIDRFASHNDYFAQPEFGHLSSVAAALDCELWARLERRFNCPLTNHYGLTETVSSALYAGPHPETGALGTIGRPVDCLARIAADGADGSVGELQLKGDNIFPGYWRNPDRTAASFTEDGWLKTGDLARSRPDGSYAIVGRLKTVIMCGGFLIRPEEIDEVLTSNPAIIESVTVGIPDPAFGEVPVTAVVLHFPVDEAELTAFARDRLEPLKVPKRIIRLDSIPRGDAGKPRLDALRGAVTAALGLAPRVSTVVDTAQGVIAVAAEVFRLNPGELSPQDTPETVEAWDSFTQIAFILALEKRFAVRIPTARAAALRSVADAISAVERVLG